MLLLVAAVSALLALASCSKNGNANGNPNQQTYVLVHGAWQAPYVWDGVRSNLESAGHTVIVVELPGHGKDSTAAHLLSMDAYRDKVINAISNVNGQAILVGHSMGGMVISHVAEKVPSKISQLVYIGAFLPQSGQALVDIANSDPDSKLGPALVESADRLTLDVKRESLTNLFVNDGTEADKQKVVANYRAEPAIPFTNKVTLTKANFGSVGKVYIKTLQDNVISPAMQDRMITAASISLVLPVNTGHSPFLSQPKKVSDLLLEIAQEYHVLSQPK